jgi:CubicO group peptidase (beta-lactamase class C family)
MRGAAWIALLLAAAFPCDAATLADDPAVAAALREFDRSLAADIVSGASPGLQAAIVFDRQVLWHHAYGAADLASGRPVGEHTRFVLGSISKLFTALAIVQLRDAGRLDLDDRITRHLTWFALAGEPHPTVTIRELLLQLGGLPREPLGGSWHDRVAPTRERMIADMAAEPPALAPETGWKYSNLGYAVLGLVVEAASGETYADYVTSHLVQPLGMADTVVSPEPGTGDLATGYGDRAGGAREARPFLTMGGLLPAAGIASSAEDMARFALWMLDDADGPVLRAQSRREMLRVQAILPDWSGGQGLGFEIRRAGDATRIGHAGQAAGYAARIEVDPASRLGVVVLANADDAAPTRLAERALALLAPAVASATAQPPPAPDPSWAAYVGTYSFEGRDSTIGIVGGRLAWFDPAARDPAATRIYLDPAGPDTFRFASGGLVGETVTFETDRSGRVVSLRAGGNVDWKK